MLVPLLAGARVEVSSKGCNVNIAAQTPRLANQVCSYLVFIPRTNILSSPLSDPLSNLLSNPPYNLHIAAQTPRPADQGKAASKAAPVPALPPAFNLSAPCGEYALDLSQVTVLPLSSPYPAPM